MKRFYLIISCFIFSLTFSFAQNKDYSGFSAASAKTQQQWETRYDSLLHTTDIDHWLKILSAQPHHVGSPGDKANVEYLLQLYRQWGFDAQIDTFYCLFPTPKFRLLEEISPTPFKASLQEQPLKEDATSSQTSTQLPTYNAFSADGDVTADLVYVNQGLPVDYDELDRLGVDVKGKIVIARYGGSWRGIKPRLAQEHGAIGCIIYSDPKDDGYYQGDTYPNGPFKNPTGVQRGSVADMPLYAGDPLTPGIGATKNAVRYDHTTAPSLLKIPVQPISYSDAQPLLAALTGPVAPENWRGALPITYHVGPGPAKVHLKLQFNWDIKQIYDVIAMMKGSESPDEWVIRGNHQDAWVNGAADPLSGQVSMLAEAQAVGELVKEGMHPKRTIVYCSWDGEEPGLMGSTEWVETNANDLKKKAVAYINTDGTGRGFFYAAGSHTLQTLVNEAAGDVKDPEYGISVLQRRIDKNAVDADSSSVRAKILASSNMKIDALGSGSDYSSFVQHLGIASVNLFFDNEDNGGEYHSIYDSYNMFRRFKDPGFLYEVALAKTAGRMTMRLANTDVLPFNFNDFYSTVNDYLNDLMKKTNDMRTSTSLMNQMISNKDFVYASDPTKKYIPPLPNDAVPFLDFSPLQNAIAVLKISADNYQTAFAASENKLPDSTLDSLNILLYQSERKLLLENGLPNRPWYKHSIYAPGYYTGYGVKTLPGVREAIENRNWTLAQQQINAVALVLQNYAQQINAAFGVMNKK